MPHWNSFLKSSALSAIENVTDVNELKEAILKSRHESVRRTAAELLIARTNDQQSLISLFNQSSEVEILKILMESINSIGFLVKLASNEFDNPSIPFEYRDMISGMAKNKLKTIPSLVINIDELKKCADAPNSPMVRSLAIGYLVRLINDEDYFASLFKGAEGYPHLQIIVLEKVSEDFLIEITADEKYSEIVHNKAMTILGGTDIDTKIARMYKCYKDAQTGGEFRENMISTVINNVKETVKKYTRGGQMKQDDETLLGYSVLALSKLLSQKYTPSGFEAEKDEYDELSKSLSDDYAKRKILMHERNEAKQASADTDTSHIAEYANIYNIDELNARIDEKTNLLQDYHKFGLMSLTRMLSDTQNKNIYSNFIKQCVIVGLSDFFDKHKDDDVIRVFYENMKQEEEMLTIGKTGFSSFEVRVPFKNNFDKSDYAFILGEVLRCLSPKKTYNVVRLLEVAEAEIPEVMDMLKKYPLRIIDPEKSMQAASLRMSKYIDELEAVSAEIELMDRKLTNAHSETKPETEADDYEQDMVSSGINTLMDGLRSKLFDDSFKSLLHEHELSALAEYLDNSAFWRDLTTSHEHKKINEYSCVLGAYLECKVRSEENIFKGFNAMEKHFQKKYGATEIAGIFNLMEKKVLIYRSAHECVKTLRNSTETLGIYSFSPYSLTHWTLYTPPLYIGDVLDRYHQVIDNLRINGVGVNIKLFENPFSIIPTLYHEYCHLQGDPNEASVFLKTQLFSKSFYGKWNEASPGEDTVFLKLNEILGSEPNSSNTQGLNDYIMSIYKSKSAHETITEKEAQSESDRSISFINYEISVLNKNESWDPQIKYPYLSEAKGEDNWNYKKLKSILVRYAQKPITIRRIDFLKTLLLSKYSTSSFSEDSTTERHNGKGKRIWTNGSMYEGGLINGNLQGQGQFTFYEDNEKIAVYTGEFKENQFHGKGKLVWENGDSFDGYWREGKMSGEGIEVKASAGNNIGFTYHGTFLMNNWHGIGKISYTSGDVYEGDMNNSVRHGRGKLELKDGTVYEGTWENGKFIASTITERTALYVNDKYNPFTQTLLIENGEVFASMFFVANFMEAERHVDAGNTSVTLNFRGTEAIINLTDNTLSVRSETSDTMETIKFSNHSRAYKNVIYLPLHEVLSIFGFTVQYDNNTDSCHIVGELWK